MRELEAENLRQDAVGEGAVDSVGARPAAAFLEGRPQAFGDQVGASDLVAQVEPAFDAVTGGGLALRGARGGGGEDVRLDQGAFDADGVETEEGFVAAGHRSVQGGHEGVDADDVDRRDGGDPDRA